MQYVARLALDAANGGDAADLSVALRMVLSLEGIACRQSQRCSMAVPWTRASRRICVAVRNRCGSAQSPPRLQGRNDD